MSPVKPGVCPVCQARFRGTPACSRCGADLTPLMQLSAQAYRQRRNARAALQRGDLIAAAEFIRQAQSLQDTPQGRSLQLLADWLAV